MLCVCAFLHCQQIWAQRKFRKIKRTYFHSLCSSTTLNVTMCIDSLEWRAQEVCLLQNNFGWTLINKQLERVNNTSLCKKKKKIKKITVPPIWQHASIFRSDMNDPGRCVVIGSAQSGMETAPWPKDSQSDSCFGMVQVNCPFDDISFFFYSKIDLNLFTYCFFKACILLMDHRSLKS